MFPNAAHLVGFFATALTLIAIPGPSVMFIIGRTLSDGRRAGLITVLFNSLGHTTWMLAVAFGLGAFLSSVPAALHLIQIIGAGYLGYLGIQSIGKRKDDEQTLTTQNASGQPASAVKPSSRKIAREAFFVGLSNPKVAVFFFAVLPQFVDPGANFTLQFLTLGIIFEIMGNLGDATYSLGASVARQWIFARTGRLAAIIGTGGLLITSLAVYLLTTSLVEVFAR
jgi:threonine/homoserine/homoserine lactone efflux protein